MYFSYSRRRSKVEETAAGTYEVEDHESIIDVKNPKLIDESSGGPASHRLKRTMPDDFRSSIRWLGVSSRMKASEAETLAKAMFEVPTIWLLQRTAQNH